MGILFYDGGDDKTWMNSAVFEIRIQEREVIITAAPKCVGNMGQNGYETSVSYALLFIQRRE